MCEVSKDDFLSAFLWLMDDLGSGRCRGGGCDVLFFLAVAVSNILVRLKSDIFCHGRSGNALGARQKRRVM